MGFFASALRDLRLSVSNQVGPLRSDWGRCGNVTKTVGFLAVTRSSAVTSLNHQKTRYKNQRQVAGYR